jgi:hypothetical protein
MCHYHQKETFKVRTIQHLHVSQAPRFYLRHDFADEYGTEYGRYDGVEPNAPTTSPENGPEEIQVPAPTSPPKKRVFGRPFSTAGWIVVVLGSLVAAIELAIFAFVVNLSHAA